MTDSDVDVQEDYTIRSAIVRIWKGRVLILSLVVLALLGAAVYVAVDALTAKRPVTYLINLRSIENGQYPNGARFSPQDLLMPEVLAEVRRQVDLPAGAPLREALSVAFDSPAVAGITRIYRDRLAARTLTQAEVTALNAAYEEELNAATRSSLRITLDYQELGVSADAGLSIARALPVAWTKVYTTQFRIFVDTRLADLSVAQRLEGLESTASVLAADDRLQVMRGGVDLLIADNRLSALRTANGISPAELRKDLAQYDRVYFNPIRAAAFGGEDAVAKAYLTELRLSMSDLRRQISAYDRTLTELRDYHQSTRSGGLGEPPTGADRGAVELGETSLAGIVDLAERASFASFVQEMLRSRNALEFELSRSTRELELAGSKGSLDDAPAYRELAAAELAELTTQYSELVAVAESTLLDRTSSLYEPTLGPMREGSTLNVRSILVVFAAGAAALFLSLMIIFVSAVASRTREAA